MVEFTSTVTISSSFNFPLSLVLIWICLLAIIHIFSFVISPFGPIIVIDSEFSKSLEFLTGGFILKYSLSSSSTST